MRHFFVIGLVMGLALPAFAQSTPPPARSTAPAISAGQQVGQILFSAAEKSIIESFFGHSATATTRQSPSFPSTDTMTTASGRILKQVLDTVSGQSASGSDSDQAEADDKGKRKNKHKGKGKGKGKGKNKNKKMPPGLAKRKSLPPGLQKQMDRNGRLPPGLAKRELPNDLHGKLPPEHKGTERVIAGSDVVLVDQATGIILDILRDVVKGN